MTFRRTMLLPGAAVLLAFAPIAVATSNEPAGDGLPQPQLKLRETRDDQSGTVVRIGTFSVWENRRLGRGRILELEVVVLPAIGPGARPDPVFIFAGGPGQNAAGLYRSWLDHWMRQQRDIVLVSQRGTGGNNRLTIKLPGSDDNLQGYLDPIFQEKVFRAGLADLRERFDLSQYSTFVAVDDVDELRRALGYEKINLYGGSYGSRVELIYLRQHGEAVRTAILNSCAPLSFKNPLHHARSAQEALDGVLKACAADPACRARYGDLQEKFRTVLERLSRAPVSASVLHPTSGQLQRVRLTREGFGEALRVMMYHDSRDVPRLIDQASGGNFDAFAQQGLEANQALRDGLAFGMLACVTCSEDVARIDPDSIAQETAGTFLGDERVRTQMAVCKFWPKSDLPPDFDQPVRSDVPVIVLSGTLDPVTPPRFGEDALKYLKNGLHLVMPGAHGVGGACVESILREFLERGTVQGIDTSCVKQLRLPPFNIERDEQPASGTDNAGGR